MYFDKIVFFKLDDRYSSVRIIPSLVPCRNRYMESSGDRDSEVEDLLYEMSCPRPTVHKESAK